MQREEDEKSPDPFNESGKRKNLERREGRKRYGGETTKSRSL